MNRLLCRRGQTLVVVGALLGAISGVTLGLAVEDTPGPATVVASGGERQAPVAASPPSTQPASSWAGGSVGRTDSDDSVGEQRAKSPNRADKRHDRTDKDGRDKSKGPGEEKTGKAETKKA